MHRRSRGRTPCVRALVDEVGVDTDVDGGVDEVGVDTNGDGGVDTSVDAGVDTNVDGGVDGVFAGATAPRLASRPAALTLG